MPPRRVTRFISALAEVDGKQRQRAVKGRVCEFHLLRIADLELDLWARLGGLRHGHIGGRRIDADDTAGRSDGDQRCRPIAFSKPSAVIAISQSRLPCQPNHSIKRCMTGRATKPPMPAAMPIDAMADPLFNLFALNTTTCCVVPAMIVNGPARDELKLPMGPGCFGGDAGTGASIGRASRLIMRNVGGQKVGLNSKSVFGQPGRVTGICVGEWEERSPWPALSVRRGVAAGSNAVTVHGATGTIDVAWDNADTHQDDEVEAVVRAAAGRLVLLYLPTSSPWLNPIEMLWRHFRREVTTASGSQASRPSSRPPPTSTAAVAK